MTLNPIYLLSDMLVHAPKSVLIEMADGCTCKDFENKCVAIAQEHEDLKEVREAARIAFKWWNNET